MAAAGADLLKYGGKMNAMGCIGVAVIVVIITHDTRVCRHPPAQGCGGISRQTGYLDHGAHGVQYRRWSWGGNAERPVPGQNVT